jgi:hypothetical protein
MTFPALSRLQVVVVALCGASTAVTESASNIEPVHVPPNQTDEVGMVIWETFKEKVTAPVSLSSCSFPAHALNTRRLGMAFSAQGRGVRRHICHIFG